jgi:hypothetical protein
MPASNRIPTRVAMTFALASHLRRGFLCCALAAVVVAPGLADLAALAADPVAEAARQAAAASQRSGAAGEPLLLESASEQTGVLRDEALAEASGMARSLRAPDLLWIVNDSGNSAEVFATGTDGSDRGSFRVEGAENMDWEDLASFRFDDTDYLLIADTGDNRAERGFVTLYVVAEPVVPTEGLDRRTRIRTSWKVDVVYPDGPRDVEAVAVDAARQQILLLSKRDVPPRLYDVPLFPPSDGGTRTARLRGEITTIPKPTLEDLAADPVYGVFASAPTAMDIASDRSALFVLTYKAAYRFERAEMDDWRRTVARTPQRIQLPKLAQTESLACDADTRSFWITTERRTPKTLAPLVRVKFTAP